MSRLLALLVLAVALATAVAVPPEDPNAPPPSKGSPEEALLAVQVDKGLKVTVWAAEPLMANPVAFCFDEQGRAFVAETNRFDKGVPDTRGHMYWLDDDLACRTVADRIAMYSRTYGDHKPYLGFENYDDQVRMVWDGTGKGKADKSSVFSKGYNRPEDGIGSGVLARKGSVYYTNIPSLYRLRDTKGTNIADVREELSTGYGVRVQYLGHDLHGLRMGPDGKLYFSIGDRGLNVKTRDGKHLDNTDSGSVLRCDPDGKNLEIVHTGLRNPQELAFDDHGNLFTYDNNCDSGDRARWVYIVEGGDSGWRYGYQYATYFHLPGVPQGNRGPWNSEKIWHVPGPDGGPPAYVVPPLAHFGNGPAGITHYPGIGLNDKYKDHFFACDFTANAGNSVIWSLAVKPKGASFEVSKPEPFVKGMVPTDCEFGPDGAFYWSDWVGGWNPPGKGRIFRVADPNAMKNPQVAEAKKLLAEGFEKRTNDELAKLLEFPHQQVRMEAQFELADRANGRREPAVSSDMFAKVLKESKNQLARLHALWGLGMCPPNGHAIRSVVDALKDADPEIRKHAARIAGGMKQSPSRVGGSGRVQPMVQPGRLNEPLSSQLAALLTDPDAAVRAAAAPAYAKLVEAERHVITTVTPGGEQAEYGPLFELLKSNNDADAYVRHAAVQGLVTLARNPADLWNVWTQMKLKHDTPAVRLGVLLALRRHRSEKVAEFLDPNDPRLAVEAARAIHDERIGGAMSRLAAMADLPNQPDALSFRALSANYHLGTPDAAARVAKFAARGGEPDHARVFALKLLADWAAPPRRDPVTGLALQLPQRPTTVPTDALRPVLAAVFSGADAVRAEAATTSTKLGLKEAGPVLAGLVKDPKVPVSTRVDALFGLASLKDPSAKDLAAFALTSDQPRLRAAGRAVRAKSDPAAVVKELPALLADPKASVEEKQGAFEILAGVPASPDADKLLAEWLDAVNAGKVQPELILDVLDAAETRAKTPKLRLSVPLKPKVDQYRSAQDKLASAAKGDKLAPWADTVAGGNPEKGRSAFLNNSAVYCQRCHRLDGQGGDVGPSLNGIAAQPGKDRRYLLESIVLPSATIAKGFETVIITTVDERIVTGIVKSETKSEIRLVTPENKEIVVPLDDVAARRTGPSAMPDDLHKKLTHRELRDIVAFLAELKEPDKK